MERKKLIELSERYSIAGVEHEVVFVDQKIVVFANVQFQRRMVIPLDEVLSNVHRGVYKFLQAAPASALKAALYLSLDEKQKAELQRKISYVNATSAEFGGRFPKNLTKNFLRAYSKKIKDSNPPGYSTLKEWVNTYRKANENPLSLVPNDWNRKPSGKRLAQVAKETIDFYIRSRFLTPERPSKQSIFNSVYAHITIDNSNKPEAEWIKPPSRATVYRHIEKLDKYLTDLHQFGPEEARKRSRYSRKLRKVVRLLERVEMDSHLIDLIVVDEYGKKLLRRAWLCTAIEVYTGTIQGWEISLTPPCAEKTLRVLKQCFSSSNPRGGKAESYYVDNGSEFQNSPVINLLNLYNSKIVFVPPKSPDQKPMIERFFGTLNTQLIHQMPGTTRSNPVDRAGYESEKRARITLPKLRAYFQEWLISVYQVAPYGDRHVSPNHAWENATSEGLPPERYADKELDLVCRAFELRKISGGRVTVHNLGWYGPGLPALSDRIGAGLPARVYYDPTDLGTVYVADPRNPTDMVLAHAIQPEYQNGLTLYEHKLAQKQLSDSGDKFSVVAAMIALAGIQERIAAEALAPFKKPSKGKKNKDIAKVDSTRITDSHIRKENLNLVKLEQAHFSNPPDELDSEDFDSFSLDS